MACGRSLRPTPEYSEDASQARRTRGNVGAVPSSTNVTKNRGTSFAPPLRLCFYIEYILATSREAINIQHIAIFRRQKPPHIDQHLGGRPTCPPPSSKTHKIGVCSPQNRLSNPHRCQKKYVHSPVGPFCSCMRLVDEPAAGRRIKFWSTFNMLTTFRRDLRS